MNAAQQLQREREARELANHRDRIDWLTKSDPRWACGTPVAPSICAMLLNQSRAAVRAAS